MRPLYLVLESDYSFFCRVFVIRPDMPLVTSAMCWATLASLCFVVGAQLPRKLQSSKWSRRLSGRGLCQSGLGAYAYDDLI